ncbi:FecR domain-containing protein [Larkinella harenae]
MRITPDLLEKYHRGLCNHDEAKAVEDWLTAGQLEENYPQNDEDDQVIADLWQDLKSEIRPEHAVAKQRYWYGYLTGLAACLVVFLGIRYFFFKPEPDVLPAQQQVTNVRYQYLQTAAGERRKFVLNDGTVVYLNSESQLAYPERFSDTARTAWLTGEAYFEVAKDSSRPFTIRTRDTQTRVLGTAFNLNAYPADQAVTLTVSEGKVRFSGRDAKAGSVLVMANQRSMYKPGHRLDHEQVYAGAYSAWRQNKLVFDNQKLAEIATTLERWYGRKVTIKSRELADRRCTGTFVNPSLEELLESLAYSANFRYQLNNKQVIIH